MSHDDILILDGQCDFCSRIAIFLRPRLGNKKLIFTTNTSTEGVKLISSFSTTKQNTDAVYLIRNKKSYIKSSAVIRCLLYLKWQYKIFYPILWLIPVPLRDMVYVLVSKYRHKIFPKTSTCVTALQYNRRN